MAYFLYDDKNEPQAFSSSNEDVQEQEMPVPFYKAYPMDNVFLHDDENMRDMEYMKQRYPKSVWQIQELVERECDKLEYDGSMMFDEYPESLRIQELCSKIYHAVDVVEANELSETAFYPGGRYPGSWEPPPPPNRHRTDYGIQDMIQILLSNEMNNRRCRYRDSRCRRWNNPF